MSTIEATTPKMQVGKRIFFIFIGIISGLAISSIYHGLTYYFLNYDPQWQVLGGTLVFIPFAGFLIFGVSGVVAGLFVKKKEDISIILLPNIVYVFGGNLGLIIYFTIIWEYYSSWKAVWSWLVLILWLFFAATLSTAFVFGGGVTGGYRLRVLKRKIEYGVPEKSVFCIRCGSKLDVNIRFCTFCGEELHHRIQQQNDDKPA